jgi:hypothetical protein
LNENHQFVSVTRIAYKGMVKNTLDG